MLATVLLLILVSVAVVTDVRGRKIYNWTTYPGMLLALGLAAGQSLMEGPMNLDRQQCQRLVGAPPLSQSAVGLLACGFVMLVCLVLFGVGGGDVKLMAMLGAFLGPSQGIEALLWTFVLGGCAGLILLVWRVGAGRFLLRLFRQVMWTLRLRSWNPLSEEERAQLRMPLFLAPSALAAVIVVRFSLLDYFLMR
ncbi:MAG: A24 family peptidase [Thermoguttaceae bacterium]|jgi:prepilin peptidase CpaA